ncbi:MAG: homoserine kinase [Candidatus Omnitrophica bacterium]|nr:homoserine kinase [Candidatus Omnitrophota bacterium]
MIKKLEISVPGCIGNLGSGFDCIGLSIRWFNRFIFEPSEDLSIYVTASGIETGQENLCFQAFEKTCKFVGACIPNVKITIDAKIPPGAGLGSSGTAIIAGVLAAFLFSGYKVEVQKIFQIANQLEGHLDNIAASYLGGLVIVALKNGKAIWKKVPVRRKTTAVFFIPDKPFSTKQARDLLPDKVPLKDAVFNLSRACFVPFSFIEGNKEFLAVALEDRLHQPYRKIIYPHYDILYRAALDSGAAGCCLSGAGPSVVAFCFDEPDRIVKKWTDVADKEKIEGKIKKVKPGGKTTWKVY